jgi:arginase
VTTMRVPHHIDEYLPDRPLQADQETTAGLPAVTHGTARRPVCRARRRGGGCSRARARPVIVPGDCTTSLGPVAGLQRAGLDVGIVWLDAHSDVQTLDTSGYLGGLPRRLLHRPVVTAVQP